MKIDIKACYKFTLKTKRRLKNVNFYWCDFLSLILAVFLFCFLWFYSRTFVQVQADIRILDNRNVPGPLSSRQVLTPPVRCPLQWGPPLRTDPLIAVNQERFLIPLLINGPNNQIIGLRDSIFLSISINRTLVLPNFYEHKSNKLVEPEMRVDLQSLSSLISFRKPAEASKLCQDEPPALFITDRSLWMLQQGPTYHRLADLSGIKSLHDGSKKDIPTHPSDNFQGVKPRQGTTKLMQELYSSNKRCAVYVYPFRSVGIRESAASVRAIHKSLSGSIKQVDPRTMDPELLYSLGYVSSPKPKFIKQIADDFRSQVISNQSVIAVHWRFDPQDWMLRCTKQDKPDGKQSVIDICNKLEKITPTDIMQGILNFLSRLRTKWNTTTTAVYFAAPLTLQKLIKDVRSGLAKANIDVYTYSDAERHLQKYSGCSFVMDHLNDVLSSIEMEICLHSAVFLSSDTSSWSSNIIRDRNANKWSKDDDSVLNIVWEAHQNRQIEGRG